MRIALVLALLAALAPAPSADEERPVREWTLVYVMSYDNNLERCGPVILDGLTRGTAGNDVAVTVLADFTDTDGLQLHVLAGGSGQRRLLDSDNSASEEVLDWYLDWVAENVPARHYAVVFLNHGGNLDDMCIDERPGEPGAKKWLSARRVGPLLREWRKEIAGEVDLVFLQQCGRGSIENLYNFREAAVAVMASQTTVGAPNTYYAATVRWIDEHRKATGFDLADQIMRADEHYTNYVCVDGKALAELPARIDPVIDELSKVAALTAPPGAALCFGGWERGGESNYDLLDWFGGLYDASGVEPGSRRAWKRFRKWVEEDLILSHERRPGRAGERAAGWTGLALFVPVSTRVRTRYRDYPLYEDSRLDELWARLYPAPR